MVGNERSPGGLRLNVLFSIEGTQKIMLLFATPGFGSEVAIAYPLFFLYIICVILFIGSFFRSTTNRRAARIILALALLGFGINWYLPLSAVLFIEFAIFFQLAFAGRIQVSPQSFAVIITLLFLMFLGGLVLFR